MTRRITVFEKHLQRAKKREWMKSQKGYYIGNGVELFKGYTAMVVLQPEIKASFKTTKNYEND